MPSDAADVPSNASPRTSEGTGQQRSERLRARRDKAGMAQVSGWVPKERRPYAREVLAALARGANSLPPDPEQAAALDAAQANVARFKAAEVAARAALAQAEQHGQALAAELDAARAEGEAAREARRQAEAAMAQAQAEAERFQTVPGLRGKMIHWLARQSRK